MAASTQIIMSSIVDNHTDIGCSCTITSNKSIRVGWLNPGDWNLSWAPSKSGIINYSISNNILTFTKTFPLLVIQLYASSSIAPGIQASIQGSSTLISAFSTIDDNNGVGSLNPYIIVPLCSGLGRITITKQTDVGDIVAKIFFPFI